ncbi:MAG: hypothetical protein Q8Q90_00415 [bacterium]|nr:hypothetical protein [bacterium]
MNNIISILTGIAMIGASALTLEGVNKATDGGFYLASIKHLAQESTTVSGEITTPTFPTMPSETANFNIQMPPPIIGADGTEIKQPMPIPPIMNGVSMPANFQDLMMQKEQISNMVQKQIKPFEVFKQNKKVFNEVRRPANGIIREEGNSEGNDHYGDKFDRQRVQKTISDITRFRNELKNTLRGIKKQASATDLAELTKIQADVDQIYSTLSNTTDSSDADEAAQGFYEGEYWDKVNSIRTRVQIPQEIKQIQQSLKRVDKALQAKAAQSLGLNIDKAKELVVQMKQNSDKVQELYNANNYEDAGELLKDFHDNGHPGDIESTITRVRDIKNTLKRIKDTEVKSAVGEVLQEVVDKFNSGEYRDARETLDEYSDDLMRLVNQFARAKTINRGTSRTQIENLGNLIEKKLQEIDVKQGQNQEPSEFNQ